MNIRLFGLTVVIAGLIGIGFLWSYERVGMESDGKIQWVRPVGYGVVFEFLSLTSDAIGILTPAINGSSRYFEVGFSVLAIVTIAYAGYQARELSVEATGDTLFTD